MRILKWDRLHGETVAEVERGGIEGEAADVHPEIELPARPPTAEALKEMMVDVDGEAVIGSCFDR